MVIAVKLVMWFFCGDEVDETLKGHVDFLLVFAHVESSRLDYQLVLILDVDELAFLLCLLLLL